MASTAPHIGGRPHGHGATGGATLVHVLFTGGRPIAAGCRARTARRGTRSRHPAFCDPFHRGADSRPARVPRGEAAAAGRPAAGGGAPGRVAPATKGGASDLPAP